MNLQLTLEIILLAGAVVILNVLDSVTTHLGFRQYPDKELRAEANPVMRWLMLKNRRFAEAFKHIGVLILLTCCILFNRTESIKIFAIMLSLVVINNSFIVISRAITKRKVISPTMRLEKMFHIPEKYLYITVVLILVVLSINIYVLIW